MMRSHLHISEIVSGHVGNVGVSIPMYEKLLTQTCQSYGVGKMSEWHKLCEICPYGELKYNLQKQEKEKLKEDRDTLYRGLELLNNWGESAVKARAYARKLTNDSLRLRGG